MSQVQAALDGIRAVAFRVGVNTLAREAGVDEDTARRLLKSPPKQIARLMQLEAAAAKHREVDTTT